MKRSGHKIEPCGTPLTPSGFSLPHTYLLSSPVKVSPKPLQVTTSHSQLLLLVKILAHSHVVYFAKIADAMYYRRCEEYADVYGNQCI